MSRVLFVFTSHGRLGESDAPTGYYAPEAAHPWHELSQAGVDVTIASISGGRPPHYGYEPEDPIQHSFFNDAGVERQLANTRPLSEVDPAQFDAVLFVGGHGTMWDFPNNPDVRRVIREIYESDRVVAAVCHGPAALVGVTLSDGSGLVEGKTVAAFTNDEEVAAGLEETVPFLLATELERQGARHTAAANFQPHVEVDGRLITGQNPASAGPLGQQLARAVAALPQRQ